MKKVFAMILALAMVLSLAVGASAASITIDPNLPTGGSTTGETYTAYKIFDATFEGEQITGSSKVSYTLAKNSPYYATIAAKTDWFTLEAITGDDTKVNVIVKEAYGTEQAKELATALAAVTGATAAGTSAYADGKYTITVDDKGYYLITDTLGTALIVDTLGSAEIDLKNAYPSLTKTSDKATAYFGDTITYTITVTVPATAKGAITVHDTLTGATYASMTEQEGVTATTSELGDACSVHFVISEEKVASSLGKDIFITYTAKVNANATSGKNSAYLTYQAFTSTKVEVPFANYEFSVKKIDGTGAGLAGAGFVVAETTGEGEAKVTKYYNNTNGIVTWVDSIDDATELKPVESGEYTITFNGLANGTYTLIEKTVPTGYNRANDQDVEIENTSIATAIEVVNNTGSELPSTGGMGTTLFYVIGAALMMGAAVLMITKKRVSNI